MNPAAMTDEAIAQVLCSFVWQAMLGYGLCAGQPDIGLDASPGRVVARVETAIIDLPKDHRAGVVRWALGQDRTEVLAVAESLIEQRREQQPPEEKIVYNVGLVDGAQRTPITFKQVDWTSFVKAFSTVRRVDTGKINAPGWLPVFLKEDAPAIRKAENIESVWALVCDLDDGADIDAAIEVVKLGGWQGIVHTTWRHQPDAHKARVILPFDTPVDASRWKDVWGAADRWAKSHGLTIDPACKDPSRLYFLPSLPAQEWEQRRPWYQHHTLTGDTMKWRWLLAKFPAPKVELAPPAMTTAGKDSRRLDDRLRRKEIFARRIVEHRSGKIVGAKGAGGGTGRNTYTFSAAWAAAQLVLAKLIEQAEAESIILAAADESGLERKESLRALKNGWAKGLEEGPWSKFDD